MAVGVGEVVEVGEAVGEGVACAEGAADLVTEVVTEQVAAGDVEDVGETDDGFDGGGGRRGEVRVQPDRGGKQPRY